MENSEKKDPRGGARPGAGRKKTLTGKAVNFTTTAQAQAILDNLPKGISKATFINAAILEKAARENLV